MKKMMFNDRFGLTKAVLQGKKTVTRRIVKVQPDGKIKFFGVEQAREGYFYSGSYFQTNSACRISEFFKCPYAIGEIVAVAQSYSTTWDQLDWENRLRYKNFASSDCVVMHGGWTNKQFVFAEDMPHQVRILNIRAERLQDITDEDCLLEYPECDMIIERHISKAISLGASVIDNWMTRRDVFAWLIDKISGKGTWERNPFVWRIEFELVK